LSNIFRISKHLQVEKKIIGTKKIEVKKAKVIQPIYEQVEDPIEQKQLLQKDIEHLQEQYQQLQNQIDKEQEKAKADIDQWWESKKEEAKLEAERLAEEAAAQGFQEGHHQGVLQAEVEFQEKRQEMQELIQTAYEERRKIVQQAEPFLLSLSIKIAEKVIKGEVKQHTSQLMNMVKQALKQVEENEDVVIQVAPEDYSIVLPFLEELETYVGPNSELKLIPVPNFTKGGCMIHTVSGSYDVTISSQLEEIKQQLLAYCEEKSNDESKE
jgi:flagellar assembly protein FliH